MSGLVAAGVALAGKDLLKKVMSELLEICKNEIGSGLKNWLSPKKVDSLYKRIATVRKVKTIWQVDKAVDLAHFYCDSHVLVAKKRKKITCYADFGLTENILIQGIAGQGKSILLRYICANELEKGNYIPIFVELNRIRKDSGLIDRILASFLSLGISIEENEFRALAKTGKLLLLLDAFDEVPDEMKTEILTDIEDLAGAYNDLKVIVTSRPNHNIQVSRHFSVVTLDNLQGKEYSNVINRLANGQAWAKGLIDHIENNAKHVKGLLCTPLMVTLLVISYKSFQQLPAKLSDFYDSLFQTLLQRHDGTKPGYSRTRQCLLDDSEYRDVFEAICILGKKNGSPSFSLKKIQSLAKNAIELCKLKANPVCFVDDIVKITCLLIRDGEEHRFIHKTVQEYYAASYIQKKPESWAKEFYSRLLSHEGKSVMTQELEFLSEIDTYRFNRFYFLPWVKKFLNISDADFSAEWQPIPLQRVASFFGGFAFISTKDGNVLTVYDESGLFVDNFTLIFRFFHAAKNFDQEVALAMEKCHLSQEELTMSGGRLWKELEINKSIDKKAIIISRAIAAGFLPTLVKAVQKEAKNLFDEANRIIHNVAEQENSSILDGLI